MSTHTTICKISFQGHDWRNVLAVRSPTGKTLRVQCNGRWGSMSPELLALVRRYNQDADAPRWSSMPTHPEVLSYAVMAEIARLAA